MKNIGEMPDFACICIGTDSKIATGNKGRVDFDIHVHGKAAHSSSPWNGINALSGARHILENLETFDLGVADHPVFGPATLTPTALKTLPNATHTVPDTATITYDRRVLPGESPEEAYEALTRRIRIQEPWTLDFEQGPIMYPNELDPNGTFAKKLKAAFSRSGYKEAETFACNFALDAGFFSRAGAEAVMLGPGEVGQFHSDEESVLVQDLVGIAQVYYEAYLRMLGGRLKFNQTVSAVRTRPTQDAYSGTRTLLIKENVADRARLSLYSRGNPFWRASARNAGCDGNCGRRSGD